MKLSTSLLPRDNSQRPRTDPAAAPTDLAVVIDVLRATSVMAAALEAGATRVLTCQEVDEARQWADRVSPRPLLCGERGCKPIEGFDLGNSPAEYVPAKVADRTLILTTTNGTRAIESAAGVPNMITASFLNLSAVVETLAGAGSVWLICAGTEGEITAEDTLLAGAILDACNSRYGAHWHDDESTLAFQLWRGWFPDVSEGTLPDQQALSSRLRETRGGRNLVRVGYENDLERCARIDSVRAVAGRVAVAPATFAPVTLTSATFTSTSP